MNIPKFSMTIDTRNDGKMALYIAMPTNLSIDEAFILRDVLTDVLRVCKQYEGDARELEFSDRELL